MAVPVDSGVGIGITDRSQSAFVSMAPQESSHVQKAGAISASSDATAQPATSETLSSVFAPPTSADRATDGKHVAFESGFADKEQQPQQRPRKGLTMAEMRRLAVCVCSFFALRSFRWFHS